MPGVWRCAPRLRRSKPHGPVATGRDTEPLGGSAVTPCQRSVVIGNVIYQTIPKRYSITNDLNPHKGYNLGNSHVSRCESEATGTAIDARGWRAAVLSGEFGASTPLRSTYTKSH